MFKGLIWQLVQVKGARFVFRFDDAATRKKEEEVLASWPEEAFCVVDSDAGFKDPFLTDCLWNNDRRLFVSSRLRNALHEAAVTDVDFLPLKVIDRSGRLLDPAFSLVHFRNAPDCLDLEASGAKRSRAIPSKAETLQRLVFKSDPARALFRPQTYSKVTLMSWPLAEALADQGFSGMRFMGLFDFGMKGDLPLNPLRAPVDTLCARLWKNNKAPLPT